LFDAFSSREPVSTSLENALMTEPDKTKQKSRPVSPGGFFDCVALFAVAEAA
jgi:hypothetical protein